MKKAFFLSITFVALLLLWGCPYRSFVPLAQPTEKINNRITGSWMSKSEANKENPSYYVIAASDSVRYAIDHFQYNETDSAYSTKQYVAHTTTIDSFIFLNMQEVESKDFLLHRVEMTKEGFILYEVTDNIDETFSDEAEMHAFFKKYMHLSFFYNKDEVQLVAKE